jgi:hypothetical protein
MKTILNTGEKSLALNLNAKTYGTFAEIGAGQKVARWVFSVRDAVRTVAKSISVCDMKVSDGLYGPVQRYVSSQRQLSWIKSSRRWPRDCAFSTEVTYAKERP